MLEKLGQGPTSYCGGRWYKVDQTADYGKVINISTSYASTTIITDRGRLFASGNNFCAKLGIGKKVANITFFQEVTPEPVACVSMPAKGLGQ